MENPLPVPIKKGEFTIEGPGIDGKLKVKVKSVAPGEKATGIDNLKEMLKNVETLFCR